MRALSLTAALAIIAAATLVLTRDPEEPWAVATLAALVAVAVAALAALVLARRERSGRRRVEAPTPRALRRGAELGAIVGALLWLRALDGLSPLTAAFVVAAFALAEYVLSAAPRSSR